MDCRVGIDLEEMDRFRALSLTDEFYSLTFTKREITESKNAREVRQFFASRFAAKEAVIKAFSCLGKTFVHNEIEILRSRVGGIEVFVKNMPDRYYCDVSMSHTKSLVTAVAIVYKDK